MGTTTKIKKKFDAVEYMRQARAELTELFHSDKKRYLEELKSTMNEFRARRKNQAGS